MPSNATDTDAFPANVQRPNNGEAADAGSLSQGFNPLTQRTRHLYNKSRAGFFDVTRAPFNADPTGGADSTAAITAAAAAAGSAGIVWIPAGTFLYSQLLLPSGVTVMCVPDRTFLKCTHATFSQIVFSGANNGPPIQIHDARFIASVVSTGTAVVNNSGGRVQFIRCSWNGVDAAGAASNNIQGSLLISNSASSETDFIDCRLKVAGILKGLHAQLGKVRVVRGTMVMPATYSEAMAQYEVGGSITLDGVRVDLTSHTTGVGYVLYANSNNVADFGAMRNCEVDATGALGTLTAFQWTSDARVVMWGNKLSITGVAPFGPNAAPHARSLVELREYVQQDFSTSASIDLRPTYGYRTHLVRNDSGSVSIILPAGVVDGQELDFIYFTGASVTPSFATTPVTATAVPSILNGNTLTGHFRWAKREASGDSDRWIQVGTWGVGLTLV